MTFLELAEKVLAEVKKPMPASEIWRYAEGKKYTELLGTKGKTPYSTLGAQLHVNARDNKNSLFYTIGSAPKRFCLKSIEYSKEDLIEDVEGSAEKGPELAYSERDLHAVLSYFLYYNFGAYSKTIDHKKSSKKQFGEWVHPDMVSCTFSIDDWQPEVYDLSVTVKETPITVRSFELKRELNFGNLRESFFQAVSNSSWAHEGYLVASKISMDKEFIDELGRLSTSFGIGFILLDVEDPDNSETLIEAEDKEALDWNTINKLTINPDFKDFLRRIKKDIEAKEIRKEWYDKVSEKDDLVKYFKKKVN
jgi:hypothetical protein